MHYKIKVETPRKPSEIPQCKHAKTSDTLSITATETTVVLCVRKHPTSECKKTNDEAPECVNGLGQHPVSYRGCEVAKKLKKKRKKDVTSLRSTNEQKKRQFKPKNQLQAQLRSKESRPRTPLELRTSKK